MGTCLSGVSREPGYLPPHDTLSHTKARILILERSSDRYYRRAYREYIDDYGIDDFADAETILETTPPGLQPILRGDVYDKRYMVTKSFTAITAHMSLWIGVDLSTYTTRTHPTCEHVLLKFARAELHRSREFRTELDLQAVVARALRRAWIPQTYSPVHRIMRCFKLNGSGGMHICLVGERMRCDLQTMLAKPERMPINSVRLIGRDLLRALDLLHRDCQLVHTDVRPGAVFVAGQPEALIRGRNRDVFDCEPCAQAGFEFPLPVVKLGHLGRATHIRWPAVLVPVGLLPYRSPEVLLGLHYGPSLDIWSLACTLFETATGAKLFDPDPFTGLGLTESQALLASITQVAGPIHSSMEAVPFARLYFEAVRGIPPEYDLQSVDEASRISRRLERLSGMDHEDAIRMEDFLKLMLDMDPVHRVEARELLRHPWLESVMEVNF